MHALEIGACPEHRNAHIVDTIRNIARFKIATTPEDVHLDVTERLG